MRWVKKEYNNPPVFITESGYSDDGRLQDEGRILYYVVSYRDFRLDFLIYIYIYIYICIYIATQRQDVRQYLYIMHQKCSFSTNL